MKTLVIGSILKVISLLLFVSIFLGYFYDPSTSDIGNYRLDYENGRFGYELGYNSLIRISQYFGINEFQSFWLLIMFIECFFILLIYKNSMVFIFFIPVFLYSASMFSYQVRYSIFCLAFVFTFIRFENKLYTGGTFFLHKVGFVPILLSLLIKRLKVFNGFFTLSISSVFIIIVLTLINIFSIKIFFYTANSLGLDYFFLYEGKDNYLANKSLSSIVVGYILLIVILHGAKVNNVIASTTYIVLLLLYFCISFNSIAIISGRIFNLLLLFLPFIINDFLNDKRTFFHGGIILFLIVATAINKVYVYEPVFYFPLP